MLKLKELYQKLQNGPIEEFKTPDIQANFNTAINSDFRIVVVAPMSSGKSTLINAIIGRDMLPAVNQATTAVSIKLDIKPIKGEQAKVNRRIDKLVQSAREKVKLEEAEYILTLFRRNLENIGEDAQVALDNALNNGVRKSCQDIVEEYAEYIRELDSDGAFNIGSYDMKQTKGFDIFNLDKAEDMLQDEKYITEEEVKVGTKTIKKKGFFSAIARIFGGGYETVNIYEDQQFVNLKQLIQDQVTEVQHGEFGFVNGVS